ncbi:hypothetical protein [Spirosoma jeollabukense]
MINLKELTFSFKQTDWKNTFVGIRKNKATQKFEFHLPKGFNNYPTNNYSSVKTLFFDTYKTYRKFFEEKKKLSEEKQFDGFSEFENGYSIEGKDGQLILYSKLKMLDSILEAYNELAILGIKNKLSTSTEIDYSKIYKYLHKAIFSDEETIFIDEMEFPKRIIDTHSPALVQMFCFIYSEIKQALDEKFDSDRIKSLSTEFKETYLHYDSSIFGEETFEGTIAILKDILDEIDRSTPYKDLDYWHFYDAIYKFLYGENDDSSDEEGNIWGISDFMVLWEELCFNEARLRLEESQFLFADRVGKKQLFNSFQNPFYFQLNSLRDKKRFLRPDLVYTNFTGAVEMGHFKKIYDVQEIKVYNHTNVKLIPRTKSHDFTQIDSIYNKYVNKNPKHIQYPLKEVYSNVSSIDRDSFFSEINNYFNRFTLSQLLAKKPCIFDFTIIDYKYITEDTCTTKNLSEERKLDIKKQLVYEFALQLNYVGSWSFSEFWIPHFFEDDQDFQIVENLNSSFEDARIKVFKRNFIKLQDLYIKEDA